MSANQENSTQLSVVIPVSNMAGRLQNLETTLLNIDSSWTEVVIVDDQYDLATGLELDSIVTNLNQPNIRIVKGRFGNPGSARNAGLKVASGDWIVFWDSDDVGIFQAIPSAIAGAKMNTKLIVGQFEFMNSKTHEVVAADTVTTLRELAKSPGIWRLIFKRENLFNFPSLRMTEDQIFILENLPPREEIEFISDKIYRYVTGNSFQLTANKASMKDLKEANLYLNKIYLEADQQKSPLAFRMYLRNTLSVLKYLDKKTSLKCATKFVSSILLRKPFLGFSHGFQIDKQKTKGHNWIFLTGGLGNQLFQLAAAKTLSQDSELTIISNLGIPRTNTQGETDITNFDLSKIIASELKKPAPWYLRKIAGFNLRIGINSTRFVSSFLFMKVISVISNLALSVFVGKKLDVLVSQGVGFSKIAIKSKQNLFIGYFQSYKWLSDAATMQKFRDLKLKESSLFGQQFRETAIGKKVLGIHIRLGDYKQESNFGILSPEYYSNAIAALKNFEDFDCIWVFSDEPSLANKIYKFPEFNNVVWIPNETASSAETLQLFRRCDGFIIANSTFSWWAAMLSESVIPEVITPASWFLDLQDPADLIPSNWKKIEPKYLSADEIQKMNCQPK